jgi:hypothetical protein
MNRQLILFIAVLSLASQANAFPVEAIAAFFGKLFKSGAAVKEAAVAGRAAEGAVAVKGAEQLATSDALKASPLLQTAIEPKPNLASEPIGKSSRDVSSYKSLRDKAAKGDTKAMSQMSSMTSTGKIADPGEPYQGYWTFQAARAHDQTAIKIAQADCKNNESLRRTDMWYDSECSYHDGRLLYSARLNTQYFPLRTQPAFPTR